MRNGIASGLKREFRTLRAALQSLDGTLQKVIATDGSATEEPRARTRLSAKGRASLVLQGRYIGHLRHLKPRQKAQVRKIREANGVKAAIAKAKRLSVS